MDTDRSYFCGCKGIRTCLLCEKKYGLQEKSFDSSESSQSYSYCCYCGKCHLGRNTTGRLNEIPCSEDGVVIPGIYIKPDFLPVDEELKLVEDLDKIPWTLSQSGRRKQNFGPKCNFRKRKLKIGEFNGFPVCGKFVQDKFKEIELLKDFITIEQCSLEYDPNKGALIEPHVDDCWVWGERIVTVNLLSDSILTLKPYIGQRTKYNLDCISHYYYSVDKNAILTIPMPRRSLLVMHDEVRYAWEHMIFRKDISKRRICLAYREFTKPFLPGGESIHQSSDILSVAHNFF